MGRLDILNKELCEQASVSRQKDLQDDLSTLKDRLASVGERTTSRVSHLQEREKQWKEFYQRQDQFADWLNQKEASLDAVQKLDVSPEEQLKQATVSGHVQGPFVVLIASLCTCVCLRELLSGCIGSKWIIDR